MWRSPGIWHLCFIRRGAEHQRRNTREKTKRRQQRQRGAWRFVWAAANGLRSRRETADWDWQPLQGAPAWAGGPAGFAGSAGSVCGGHCRGACVAAPVGVDGHHGWVGQPGLPGLQPSRATWEGASQPLGCSSHAGEPSSPGTGRGGGECGRCCGGHCFTRWASSSSYILEGLPL